MEEPAKGTVTSLSSLFPADEALKASKHVQGAIAERQKELDQLRSFIADNTNLINLVQKLPEELHHDIMVPFGKAAFFPGRLVHTNEFLVLLGEGYYAERTSKQTIDILKRRGKTLESQVESLKAVMQDLKAEASFFDSTAAEVAEGLVEIREEYEEESSAEVVPKAGLGKSEADCMKVAIQEDEYAHIMARMDELEQEELAAESVSESDGDEERAHVMSKLELEGYEHSVERVSKYGEDNSPKADFGHCRSQHVLDNKHKSPEAKEEHKIGEVLPCKLTVQQDLGNQVEGLQVQSVSEDKSSSDQGFGLTKSSSEGKVFVLPGVEENVQVELLPEKAFIGSIVEHTHNMRGQADSSSKSTTPTTSKPVSRFKMQRKSNV